MPAGKGFRCDFCGNSFASAKKLQKHFVQLHVREMNKRLKGPDKRVQKTLDNKAYMDRCAG